MPQAITKTVEVGAPPPVVFRALTDPKEIAQWMASEAEFDARVGGEYVFSLHLAERGIDAVATGKVLELVPNQRLSYTFDSTRFGADPSPVDSVVTWTLDELPGGNARVTLVHKGTAKEQQKETDAAWGLFVSRLESHCKDSVGRRARDLM
jgi:uncharacterized protein YndB with AHSA1/START domain